MTVRNVAVMGATGGCGTTTMTTALAVGGGIRTRRLLALDGHGGGAHLALGVPVSRGIDDLHVVRSEVEPGHVHQIAHQGMGEWELIAGPAGAASYGSWVGDPGVRLTEALLATGPWVADLGRGDHVLAHPIARRAAIVVVMMPRSLRGAEAGHRLLEHHAGCRMVAAAVARPGEDHISMRALRRLMRGVDVVEVPWDRRGVDQLPSVTRGRRGLAACVRGIGETVASDG